MLLIVALVLISNVECEILNDWLTCRERERGPRPQRDGRRRPGPGRGRGGPVGRGRGGRGGYSNSSGKIHSNWDFALKVRCEWHISTTELTLHSVHTDSDLHWASLPSMSSVCLSVSRTKDNSQINSQADWQHNFTGLSRRKSWCFYTWFYF